MKLILQMSRRMSDVRDENKAPKPNEGIRAATGNMQESLVKKEKNRTFENSTEEEKIMLMMKESTEAYDPKYYVKIPQRKRKSAWSLHCKRCGQKGHSIQNCPLLHSLRTDGSEKQRRAGRGHYRSYECGRSGKCKRSAIKE
ncbi:E3 ubiquitin-protein ligase RBBP6 [Trichinella nelsoni]|uniref:E3 ubiquitin-protein ligase RBBP6 n=1 Tax=Trichinella nelsoni TaxID=6336 RepID=A0A0V0REL1_9BILA|nr:E3 ubiquitin-protein ligase RBBP6 [Trichinella nelsoni]